jgi:hypothetical protein
LVCWRRYGIRRILVSKRRFGGIREGLRRSGKIILRIRRIIRMMMCKDLMNNDLININIDNIIRI